MATAWPMAPARSKAASSPPRVLVIGDEILSGRTKDKNIGYIAEYLTGIGIDLKEVRVVPDEEPEIVAAVNALRARYTYLFTTGGIGPTHDDITAECVAKAFGVPIDYHPRAVEIMQARVAADRRRDERGAHAHDARSGRRRACAQQGLRRRPGFWIGNVIVMAGIPSVMQAMLDYVTPQLKTGARMLSESVRADCREGDIGTELGEIAKGNPDVVIGSYPFHGRKRRGQYQCRGALARPAKARRRQSRGRGDARARQGRACKSLMAAAQSRLVIAFLDSRTSVAPDDRKL